MARVEYLADTSVFARLSKPVVAATFAPLVAGRLVAVSAPVIFELGFSARSPGDYRELMDGLAAYPTMTTADADHRRALEVQALLAGRSRHRALSLVDALVAAVAEARQLTVLHYDLDFETVSKLTGQPQRWIVSRGSSTEPASVIGPPPRPDGAIRCRGSLDPTDPNLEAAKRAFLSRPPR